MNLVDVVDMRSGKPAAAAAANNEKKNQYLEPTVEHEYELWSRSLKFYKLLPFRIGIIYNWHNCNLAIHPIDFKPSNLLKTTLNQIY